MTVATAVTLVLISQVIFVVFSSTDNDEDRGRNDIQSEIKKLQQGASKVAKRVDGVVEHIDRLTERMERVFERMERMDNITERRFQDLSDKIDRYHPTPTTSPRHSTKTVTVPTTNPTPTTTPPTTTPIQWVFYPPGTKEHRAKKVYPEYHLHFVGFGIRGSRDAFICKYVSSFDGCLQWCVRKRNTDGRSWNGVSYGYNVQWCCCTKNDKGHIDNNSDLHYRFN